HPGKKRLYVRFAMRKTVKLFGLSRELKRSNVVLDRVERANAPECLVHALRFCGLGFNELAARMTPTQGMSDTDFLRIARIGSEAVGQQHRARGMVSSEDRPHVLPVTGGEVREAHLVV